MTEEKILTKMQQKKLALTIMPLLKINKNTIECFAEKDEVHYSDQYGILHSLPDKIINEINQVEKRTGGTVFHVLKTECPFGTCWSCLYIPKYELDAESHLEDAQCFLKRYPGELMAYVYNEDFPYYSEFGYINAVPKDGGLQRLI